MAPSIDSMVFTLRRVYALERAQLAVYEFVDDVMLHWDRFALTEAFLPNRDSALAYLERCHAAGERPDRPALTATLLPWYLDD